jgi:hypothetical protein
VRIEAVTIPGIERAMHPVAIALSGAYARHMAMPDSAGPFRQADAVGLGFARSIKQAKLDALGMLRREREIGAQPIGDRPQLDRRAGGNAMAHAALP